MEITKETLDKFGVSRQEFATMLLCTEETSASEIVATIEASKNKGYLYKYSYNNSGNTSEPKYFISDKGKELLENMSAYTGTKDCELNFLDTAAKMRALFPKGIKDGTNSRWVDGLALVSKRLKQFTQKYGEFTEDEIVEATKRYVDSFSGNYQRMRTLRYFIWAEKRNPGTGEVEYTSDLLNCLEDTEDENKMVDWEVNLR